MALRAGLRRREIVEDLLAIDVLKDLVTARAGHIAVLALQRERGSLVVIEGRWLPLCSIVAVPALSHLVSEELGELAGVDVFVALLAFLRSLFEIHIGQPGFHVGRLVAVDAGHGSMCARQGERSRAVVKPIELAPGLGRVACLAPHRLAVLAQLPHALVELPLVHILVTTGAGQVFEVVRNFRLRLIFVGELVAIPAGHRDVPTGKLEPGLLMLRQREG